MLEIEVKVPIQNRKETAEKILASGAILKKSRFHEENTLYDFPSRTLYQKQHALRIRTVRKKCFLTFKGSTQKSRKFKIREEFETEVKNKKQIKKILKSLGLTPVFTYKKFRTVYTKKRLNICLDETSIGDFLELEGERNEIVRFAKNLGFSKKDFIKKDYIQMIKNHQNHGNELS